MAFKGKLYTGKFDPFHLESHHDLPGFISWWKLPETQQRYGEIARLTATECEEILKSMDIKGVVLSRTKGYESFKTKLRDMAQDPEFQDWIAQHHNICKHPEMGDLAGVRIGLYFPNDVVKVATEIEKRFLVQHRFGTVTGGRDAVQGRNLDIQKHMQGQWRSQDHDGVDEYWEHSGYKSWQVVIEQKPRPENPNAPPIEHFGSLFTKGTRYEPGYKKERDRAADSQGHRVPDKRMAGGQGASGTAARSDLADNIDGNVASRVEIQVGTMVTQAWAEVQHNVIYKNPTNILTTPTMKRMVDAINGLAITTEIMLNELERNLEVAKKEAEQQGMTLFRSGDDFLEWFRSTYVSRMRPGERKCWVSDPGQARKLLELWHQTDNAPKPCHTNFSRLIEKRELLQRTVHEDRQLDISRLILGTLNYHSGDRNLRPGFHNLNQRQFPWV